MNLSTLLKVHANKQPDHEALVSPSERVSYREWDERVNRMANGLRNLGFKEGDKLIIHLPNVPEFLYLYMAAIRRKDWPSRSMRS